MTDTDLPRGDDYAELRAGNQATICCGATVDKKLNDVLCSGCGTVVGWGRTSADIEVKPKKSSTRQVPEWARKAIT